ncbi:SLC13 family permease [Candidatus Neomarinimicrobiota bacterium]
MIEFQIIGIVILLLLVLAFLMLELLPIDVIAIGLLAILWLAGLVTPEEALSGFSNKAVITVAAMFVLSRALVKTGIPEYLIQRLINISGEKKWLSLAVFLISVSVFSGFINNVAAAAIFIPVAMHLSSHFKISPSKLMIPLSYAAIYGGTLTLIGTSTNLLVNSISERLGQEPLGMFEFFYLGFIFLIVGTLYNLLILPRLLPDRADNTSLVNKYRMAPYLTEFEVGAASPLINSTCIESDINNKYDVTIVSIIRGEVRFDTHIADVVLQPGDILYARGTLDGFIEFRKSEQVLALTDVKLDERELRGEENTLVEGFIPQESNLIGKTLKEINFRKMFGSFVLAIGRQGDSYRKRVAHIYLRFADILLMLVPQSRLGSLMENSNVIILQSHDVHLHKHRFWWLAIAAIPAIMAASAFSIMDIMAGALLVMFLLFVTRNITTREAYQAINWPIIMFIAAFIPFGIALEKTGTTELIGSSIAHFGDYFPVSLAPYAILSLLYITTSLLTEILSNKATAIVLTPIAITIANEIGVDARPFIFAICYAASASFMTPIGYQTNLMVYGPGKYKFTDYLKAGAPLNLIFWIIASIFIPVFWPF